MHLDSGCAVLEIVGSLDRLAGELALLADGNECLLQLVSYGYAENESARLGTYDNIKINILEHIDDTVNGHLKSVGILKYARYIAEHDSGLGKIGNGSYIIFCFL